MARSKTTCPRWHLGQKISQSKKPCFLVVFEVNKSHFEFFLKIKQNGFLQKYNLLRNPNNSRHIKF